MFIDYWTRYQIFSKINLTIGFKASLCYENNSLSPIRFGGAVHLCLCRASSAYGY